MLPRHFRWIQSIISNITHHLYLYYVCIYIFILYIYIISYIFILCIHIIYTYYILMIFIQHILILYYIHIWYINILHNTYILLVSLKTSSYQPLGGNMAWTVPLWAKTWDPRTRRRRGVFWRISNWDF